MAVTRKDKEYAARLAQAYHDRQVVLAAKYAGMNRELAMSLYEGGISGKQFRVLAIGNDAAAHKEVSGLAKTYLHESRALLAPHLLKQDLVVPDFDLVGANVRAVSTVKYISRDGEEEPAEMIERAANKFAAWTDRAAKNVGRDTVRMSAEAASSGWMLKTDGHPCAFCAFLAGMGEDIKGGASMVGRVLHEHCGCTFIEVPFGIEPVMTPQERAQRDLFEEAYAKGGTTTRQQVAWMRQHGHGVINDAVVPPGWSRSVNGEFVPPKFGAGPFKPMGDPPDENDKKAWKAYWKKRQDAIPLDFKGDDIDANEIQSYERLVRLRQAIDPIKKQAAASTNDFVWLNKNGLRVEMKTPNNRSYEAIRNRIYDSVKNAMNNQLPNKELKQVFLVDLQEDDLKEDLRLKLINYNLERSKYKIQRLWLLSDDGKRLDEIELKTAE